MLLNTDGGEFLNRSNQQIKLVLYAIYNILQQILGLLNFKFFTISVLNNMEITVK